MIDHTTCVRLHFFNLHLYTKRAEYCTLLFPMVGIKPGLSAQQASALFITPLPLSDLAMQYKFSSLATFINEFRQKVLVVFWIKTKEVNKQKNKIRFLLFICILFI